MKDKDGVPVLKQWRFITTSQRQAVSLSAIRCEHEHSFKHAEIVGSLTKLTEQYPLSLCRTMLNSLFNPDKHTPAMPCTAVKETPTREQEIRVTDFGFSPLSQPCSVFLDTKECTRAPKIEAAVTKLLSRDEMRSPPATKAIRSEGRALVECGTWDESTVVERDVLFQRVKDAKQKISWGDLLTLCSIKFFEKGPDFWKYKGRICFRGDKIRDQDGAPAVFQELSSSPAAIQAANANIAYGLIPGHKSTVSDALSAFTQAYLKTLTPTWVTIPKTLWPDHWHGKFHRPMCLLVKALYGHPESGGHWEQHLEKAVRAIGGVAIPEHPSNFFFAKERLLLTIYVDDLLLSGPAENHDKLWRKLREGPNPIALDDPEPLDRFLGRNNTLL